VKLLDGTELAGYIKERQAKEVRNLRQSHSVQPKLAIIQTTDNPVIDTYVRMKQAYGSDILIDVEIYRPASAKLMETITACNEDAGIHGIIIQLPLEDESQTEAAVNAVAAAKDVDGLGEDSRHVPATALAIDWLLHGYNVVLTNRKLAIVGNGRLVGAPLARLWNAAGYDVTIFDERSKNMPKQLRRYAVVVTATGVPGLVTAQMLQPGAVVVDAATSAEHGKIVGDLADDVRARSDLTITPEKGGVGPLTVAALFDNVIRAARQSIQE
jgi:methylenetetrahydrofolate dehydrogenase (NADP+)/methenyltetrahydrofolate cyclohydrolase